MLLLAIGGVLTQPLAAAQSSTDSLLRSFEKKLPILANEWKIDWQKRRKNWSQSVFSQSKEDQADSYRIRDSLLSIKSDYDFLRNQPKLLSLEQELRLEKALARLSRANSDEDLLYRILTGDFHYTPSSSSRTTMGNHADVDLFIRDKRIELQGVDAPPSFRSKDVSLEAPILP